jgi:thioredoxin-related protein
MRPFLLVVLFLVLSVPFAEGADDVITWHSLSQGRKKARIEKKPMVVDFYTDHACPRCREMERHVYRNPEIARKLNSEFIAVRIDLGRELEFEEKMLGERYGYREDCLLLFLDRNEKVMKDASGKGLCFTSAVTPDAFLDYLEVAREKLFDR